MLWGLLWCDIRGVILSQGCHSQISAKQKDRKDHIAHGTSVPVIYAAAHLLT